jgi:nucleotidyltransferase/DNA polymerase involved in DNA repair
MRLGEALATCPELVLVEQDPAAVEAEWERILRRLEGAGLAVEPAEPGCVFFETRGIERLAGGLDAALRRALEAVGPSWGARIGAATRRFAALAAASVAPEGRAVVVDDGEAMLFLEPLPLDLLPLTPDRRRELSEMGIRRLGELARLPGPSVADRLGPDGAHAWRLARGEDVARVTPRRPPAELAETLAFPEAVANTYTLERALAALLERLLAHPERAGRAPRQLVLTARLASGGSWRHAATLREPTAEPARLRAALAPRLADLPGPVVELRLALGALADSPGIQEELVRPRGSRLRELLRDGLRQARVAAGADAVCTVMEVAPWSRIPEARALLVPRED